MKAFLPTTAAGQDGVRRPVPYPGITDNRLIDAANAVLSGEPWVHPSVNVCDYQLFHNQDYAAAGQTNLRFFNVAGQDSGLNFITNMPQANSLPADHLFVCRAIAVTPYWSRKTDGTAVVSGSIAEQHADTAASNTFLDNINLHSDAMRAGSLELKIGDRIMALGTDLTRWPPGRGMTLETSQTGTFTANTLQQTVQNLNSGRPDRNSINVLQNPFIIWPFKQIQCNLNWQSAIASTGAFSIGVELIGTLIRKP